MLPAECFLVWPNNGWFVTHHLVDTQQGSRSLLEEVHHPAKGDHWPGELCEVASKLYQLPKSNTSINNIQAAAPEQHHRCHTRQEVHCRPQQRIVLRIADTTAHVFPVIGPKCLQFLFFLRIGFHHPNTRKILLRASGHLAKLVLNRFVASFDLPTHHYKHNRNQWQD